MDELLWDFLLHAIHPQGFSSKEEWCLLEEKKLCSQSWKFFYLAYLPSGFYESPKSTLPNGEVYVAISAFPNYPIPNFSIWLICQVDFMSIPSPLCQMATFTLPTQHSLVTNSTSPRQDCHIAKSTSPCGLPKWASSCPRIKKFWTNALVFIWSAQTLVQNSDCPSIFFFFHMLPRLTHHPPSLCLSASFWLDGSLKLERSWQLWECGIDNHGLDNWAMWILPFGKMDLTIGQCGFCHLAKWTWQLDNVDFAIWQNGLDDWTMWILPFGKMDLTNLVQSNSQIEKIAMWTLQIKAFFIKGNNHHLKQSFFF